LDPRESDRPARLRSPGYASGCSWTVVSSSEPDADASISAVHDMPRAAGNTRLKTPAFSLVFGTIGLVPAATGGAGREAPRTPRH
jgi:hypothetical protein